MDLLLLSSTKESPVPTLKSPSVTLIILGTPRQRRNKRLEKQPSPPTQNPSRTEQQAAKIGSVSQQLELKFLPNGIKMTGEEGRIFFFEARLRGASALCMQHKGEHDRLEVLRRPPERLGRHNRWRQIRNNAQLTPGTPAIPNHIDKKGSSQL